MHLFILLACLFGNLRYAEAAGKTHIYIDQIPIYTKLKPCAQDPISAIVRAQASGCGDDTQLTSFACFCIDSSSEFASIISTAVADKCSNAATEAALTGRHVAVQTLAHRVKARATTPGPTPTGVVAGNVQSALDAFESYCAKSTELTRFQQPTTVGDTQAPKTIYVTHTASSDASSDKEEKKSTPIASIVVPVILIPLALGVALYFFLRYRRQQRDTGIRMQELQAENSIAKGPVVTERRQSSEPYRTELYTAQHRVEMPQSQNPAVELDAGAMMPQQKEKHSFI